MQARRREGGDLLTHADTPEERQASSQDEHSCCDAAYADLIAVACYSIGVQCIYYAVRACVTTDGSARMQVNGRHIPHLYGIAHAKKEADTPLFLWRNRSTASLEPHTHSYAIGHAAQVGHSSGSTRVNVRLYM